MATPLPLGTRVRDQADDADSDLAVVVACSETPASEYEIEDTGQTVADYNPDADPSTSVVEVAFQPALDDVLDDWQTLDPDALADVVAEHEDAIQTYAYPVDRLDHVADPPCERTGSPSTTSTTPPTHSPTDASTYTDRKPRIVTKTHPDASPQKITAWFDGLCEPVNPGGLGATGVVVAADGTVVYEAATYLGTPDDDRTMTNNVAEYTAAIAALEYVAANYPTATVTLRGDSQLVIRQLTGAYAVNSARLRPLWQTAHEYVRNLDASLDWVPREQNERADELSRRAYQKHVTQPAREARQNRASSEDMQIDHLDGPRYRVKDEYVVDLAAASCTCPDFEHRGGEEPCKHVYAVADATGTALGSVTETDR